MNFFHHPLHGSKTFATFAPYNNQNTQTMNLPKNQFSEADFQRAWQAAKDDVRRLRDLGIKMPASMRPEPYSDREDDYGNPLCTECGSPNVRFHGDVCKPCAAEYRYDNFQD